MKKLKLHFFLMLTLLFGAGQFLNAQFCSDFGEGDFGDLCVSQTGDGTSGAMMSNMLDIFDAATSGAGTDGTGDIQLTMEAVVCNTGCPESSGAIGGCIGAASANVAIGDGSQVFDFKANFNANGGLTGPGGENTCINGGGYICITIDFLNGFSSTAAGFNLEQSSNNGSSEGYEGSFGYVTAGTDASGNPLTLPAVNLASFCNYTSTDYATTQMSTFVGATGPGSWQTDVQNTTPNNTGASASDANGQNICGTTTSDNGEDTESGNGATNGDDANQGNANLGLNPTDIITQVKYVYFYSTTASVDCDGDGLTAANSNPQANWSDVSFCFDPPCGFPEPTIALEENCGTFNFNVGMIDESMASGTGTMITYTTAATAPMVTAGTAVTGAEGLAADGTTDYWIQVIDAGDATCADEFGPFTAPVGNVPSCGTFPANQAGTDPSEPDNTSN